MDSNRNPISLALAAPLSTLALYFGTGLHPIWWLAWIAPIPILLLAPRVSPRRAFGVAFIAWAAGSLNQWHYFHGVLQMPLPVVLTIMLVPALFFAAAVSFYRGALKTSAWRAALIFPSFWIFYEFLGESLSPHSTAGNISYSQMNFLPVLQLASVTGIWGISFCMFLFAAMVSVLLSSTGNRDQKRSLVIAVGVVLMAVLSFGAWRLNSAPASDTVMVGLVASDLPQNILAVEHADALRLLREYADAARKLAVQGAQVVVMPEKIAVVLDSDLPEVDSLFKSVATQTGASVIMGVIHPSVNAKWNEARLYSPDGQIRTYEKHHMLPPFESSFKVGTDLVEWNEPSGRWGITICKDMDFPRLSRDYGNHGTALLLVPAWDFVVDGWLHGRMAILRGVESGFSMARAPKQGILTVTDSRGRVLAELQTNAAPFASLLAAVPVRHHSTIYARFGDWFAWANLVLWFVLIASMFYRPRLQRNVDVRGRSAPGSR